MPDTQAGQEAAPKAPPRRGLIRSPRVFVPAAALLLVFSLLGALLPEQLGDVISAANATVGNNVGWWYVLLVTSFVAFALWMALSPWGAIRLGKDDTEPEFGLGSWFAMLFAAGMGIGLVFWGVAEPLNHYAAPPPGTQGDEASVARNAMDITYLHWGFHAWAIYVVVGLAMAYAVHRKGRPVSIRWALEPILGKRTDSVWGDLIDVIAIVGTIFGVATSLGFGVSQIGAGLSFLGAVEEATDTVLVVLIVAITLVALISVVTGIDKGIRYLSNTNMVMAGLLMAAVLVLGPTVFLLSDFVQQIGSYLQGFLRLSFDTYSFRGEEGQAWLGSWTTYYWGWWISWAPFVGIFIARISRGRTVRQFIAGVLLVPTLLTFLWFAIMGGSALYRELFGEGGMIGEDGVSTDLALFQLLDGLPLATLLSWIAIFLIVVFFVTSSDSGSFVVDMIASGGDPNPPVWSRAFWAGIEGVIAAVLLVAGGLAALQTMAILVALPFSIVMVLMMVATAKALMADHKVIVRRRERALTQRIIDEVGSDGQDGTTGTAADTAPVITR